MRVLVHALPTKMGGAKRHLNNMMNALASSNETHKFFVVVNDRYDTSVFDGRVETISFPIEYSSGIKRLYLDNIEINRIIEEKKIDLLISFANIGPFKPKCKHILFEMNALYFCKNITPLYSFKERIGFAGKRALIRACAKNADLIVTPSKTLMKQISDSLKIPGKKFQVLHHAMQKEFCEAKENQNLFDEDKVSFLYPSHLARHKGVHILIEALKLIEKELLEKFEVICTFERSDDPKYYDILTKDIEKHSLGDTIRFIGHLPQEKINALYAEADYMIYTTLCESFGFSMLEAKVFHLPALCSDIPINREIAKKSAKYYRWDDPYDLAKSLKFFVDRKPEDFDFEDDLLEWRWEDYAKRLIDIMEEVACG